MYLRHTFPSSSLLLNGDVGVYIFGEIFISYCAIWIIFFLLTRDSRVQETFFPFLSWKNETKNFTGKNR